MSLRVKRKLIAGHFCETQMVTFQYDRLSIRIHTTSSMGPQKWGRPAIFSVENEKVSSEIFSFRMSSEDPQLGS
jgi:hypothetical protein